MVPIFHADPWPISNKKAEPFQYGSICSSYLSLIGQNMFTPREVLLKVILFSDGYKK